LVADFRTILFSDTLKLCDSDGVCFKLTSVPNWYSSKRLKAALTSDPAATRTTISFTQWAKGQLGEFCASYTAHS